MFLFVFTALACMLSSVASLTPVSTAKRAICIVDSVASSINLLSCTEVIITPFTVPAGNTINITAAPGASILLAGSVTFAQTTTPGPLFTFNTSNALFNGNGFIFEGNGPCTSGGTFKPHPLVEFQGSGTFTNFTIRDSPAQAISIATNPTSLFTAVTVSNGDGNALGSNGEPVGVNTDGFDVSASNVTISGSIVVNQGDCIAITSGNNITFVKKRNVSGVTFTGNLVFESMYGARINVNSNATNASVRNITYTGNTITPGNVNQKYGLLITQSYPEDFGTPGTNSVISNITFNGTPTQQLISTGQSPVVGVNCGNCAGNWSWTSLNATGGIDLVMSGGARLIFNGLS
ncbi:pectin lyase fold/virulence factor [Rhodocollybia butyracea]|uniref:endo-polygalacturonase n=1 Tax=Rhodocollybia butyracea TaxID=206335 RepID=A0A9P5P4G3_9AGAR|nr:pectin lyase fold/virulence factor [Rhodocollybia butyracea]